MLRKNGSQKSRSNYQCAACRHQLLFVPAAVGKAAQFAEVAVLLIERSKGKIWLWLAVERHSRRIVAGMMGGRGAATLRRSW